MYRTSSFSEIPEVVKNLLIINVLLFLATISLESKGINLIEILGISHPQSNNFRPYQLITHMFMHGSFGHLFWNMFAIWMFGKVLENIWGGKRFLIYYMITGLGAATLHLAVIHFQLPEVLDKVQEISTATGIDLIDKAKEGMYYPQITETERLAHLLRPTVGASGALFGILLAFGMLFPNTLLYVYLAIPIKAKYFVMLYGGMELILGTMNRPTDNVAHFAHLGGMIFGYILLKYWKKDRNAFY